MMVTHLLCRSAIIGKATSLANKPAIILIPRLFKSDIENSLIFLVAAKSLCTITLLLLKYVTGSIEKQTAKQTTELGIAKKKAKQTNIVDVATQLGINVVKKGKYYIALCPFHNDKNPSLFLYPNTNSYYCFGCQEHGDIIDLYAKLTGADFKTAVKELAQ